MANPTTVKITLTPEQQAQLREATGQTVATLKLETLEHRLTPSIQPN